MRMPWLRKGKAGVRKTLRSCCPPVLCGLLAVALAVPAWPVDLDDIRELDLPAGQLEQTLLEIGTRYGVIVSFPPGLAAQRTAPPIFGRMTLLQALSLATQPNGLRVQTTASGAVSIAAGAAPVPVASAAAGDPAASQAPAIVAVLPPVEVVGTGRQDNGLRAVRASSATRVDAPLADLPQQVSVVNSETLALQGPSSGQDATRYVPGVMLTEGLEFGGAVAGGAAGRVQGGNLLGGIRLRGMIASVALSGMRTVRNMVPVDSAFLERVEVVKGPTGVLTGIADPGGRGGVVNLVRKQAGPDVHTDITQSISTQDQGTLRLGADVGGELDTGSYWRLIGYGSVTGRTEGGYTRQGGAGVLGTLSHRSGGFTARLTVQADRQRVVPNPSSRGGRLRNDDTFAPVEPGVAPPNDPNDRALASSADAELDLAWTLSPTWRATLKTRLEAVSVDSRRHDEDALPLPRFTMQPLNAGLQAGLEHTVSLASATHRLFFGLDVERWRYVETQRSVDFDLLFRVEEFRQSLLLQDLVSAGPWRVRLALQRGWVPTHSTRGSLDRDSVFPPTTNWDVGVLRYLSPTLSLYAGAQSSAQWVDVAPGSTLQDGAPIPLTALHQVQAGFRNDLLGGRLTLSLEAFALVQSNALVGVEGLNLQSGRGTAAQGLELELAGRPAPSLDLRLGWALTGGQDLGANLFEPVVKVVRPLGWVPRQALRLLTRYRLPERVLSGTDLTLAMQANSFVRLYSFDSDAKAELRLPGGARFDLSLARTVGPWTLTTSVGNVFDRPFYGVASDPRTIIPLLPGRSLTLTALFRD